VTGSEPFILAMPGTVAKHLGSGGSARKNLLVVDTQNDFSVQKFRDYDTVVWLAKNQVAIGDKENDIRINDLAGSPGLRLDRPLIDALSAKSRWVIGAGSPLLVLAVLLIAFIGILLLLSAELIFLLIAALFIWGIEQVRKADRGYKKAFQVALHAGSVAVLINAVGLMTGAPLDRWVTTLITVVIAWINLSPKAPVVQSV
jgi:hypothetical protein